MPSEKVSMLLCLFVLNLPRGLFSLSRCRWIGTEISFVGFYHSEVPNRRGDRNKQAGLEKCHTLFFTK